MRRIAMVMVTAGLLACAAAGCRTDAARAAASVTVDSALNRDEALRRFRSALPAPVALAGGASSRAALAEAWTAGLAGSDTATLRRLVLSQAEFAWLFYPTSPQGLPPYDLSPGLMWDMLSRQTERGINYELRHLAGKPLTFAAMDCGEKPSIEGDNRLWGPCLMTLVVNRHDTLRARLTGPIIERQGRFKFVSYTNELD